MSTNHEHETNPIQHRHGPRLQNGTKTVTRRVVKQAEDGWSFVGLEERPYERRIKSDGTEYPKQLDGLFAVFSAGNGYYDYPMIKAPYRPGHILYVRETWCPQISDEYPFVYKASVQSPGAWKWRPSIHMPREAARIFLRVTDVRVERLQDSFFKHGSTIFSLRGEGVDIGEQCRDCISDYGSPCCIDDESECGVLDEVRGEFADLWDSTINPADRALYGWDANPWVWVIEFERISKKEALS